MIEKCVKERIPGYKHERLEEGEDVLVQFHEEGHEWQGPYKVIRQEGSIVKIRREDSEREVNRARVAKYYDWGDVFEEEKEIKGILKEKKEEVQKVEEKSDRQTRSQARKVRIEEILNTESSKTKDFEERRKLEEEVNWIQRECMEDEEEGKYLHDVYVVELPMKEHSREDVQVASYRIWMIMEYSEKR
jgi:hypothetical protein